jgi:poly(ribitol-phosphate) beta-N-acetylglucosaminyltransferase
MTKVSVIVPVYNPGDHIDDCIASLLDQSLPTTEYEAIFVDDGSTDDTPARLDALAAEHEHVRVEHIPNSGWPGKPRNVGIGLARGDFVYFVDNDDWIEREALERLYAMATQDDADVVVGKVVSQGKFVPRGIFKENLHGVDLQHGPLLGLLTPHKLFRRSLLDEYGIRYPEGRRRLEDHVFVMHAYFHARRVSVLADYPCYHWMLRDADTNASYAPFDPVAYFENVREVLDLVEEHTEPGPERDRLMRHWYRGKMLGRVGGSAFVKREPEYNRALYEEIHTLALERYTPEIADKLPFNLRVRSRLLRDGSFESLMALAEREGELRTQAQLTDVRGDGSWLALEVRAELAGAEHGPLTFRRDGERVLWNPPETLRDELPDEALDFTASLANASLNLLLVDPGSGVEWQLAGKSSVELEHVAGDDDGTLHAVLHTRVVLAPSIVAAGKPLAPGDWELHALATLGGFSDVRVVRYGKPKVRLVSDPPARLRWVDPTPPPPPLTHRVARKVPGLRPLVRRVRGRAPAQTR